MTNDFANGYLSKINKYSSFKYGVTDNVVTVTNGFDLVVPCMINEDKKKQFFANTSSISKHYQSFAIVAQKVCM